MPDQENEIEVPAQEVNAPKENGTGVSIVDDNRANKHIDNRIKYLPKYKENRVVIPFVIPWEQTAAKETQKGMGAFGRGRDPVTNVSGGKELTKGELNADTILSCFAESNKFESQKGMRSFGAHRVNVSKFTSSKEMDPEKAKLGESIIPLQSGSNATNSQAGNTPMGARRRQVPKIEYRCDMSVIMDPESETFLSRLMTPNPNNKAGTTVIDVKRSQVPGVNAIRHTKKTEGIVPKLFNTKDYESVVGTGAGASGLRPPRQVTTKSTGGYIMTDEEIIASKQAMPFTSKPDLESQAGMGGFQKPRDIVTNVQYKW